MIAHFYVWPSLFFVYLTVSDYFFQTRNVSKRIFFHFEFDVHIFGSDGPSDSSSIHRTPTSFTRIRFSNRRTPLGRLSGFSVSRPNRNVRYWRPILSFWDIRSRGVFTDCRAVCAWPAHLRTGKSVFDRRPCRGRDWPDRCVVHHMCAVSKLSYCCYYKPAVHEARLPWRVSYVH